MRQPWQGKLETQPDSDTGKHGEWLTEYKIWEKTGGKDEQKEDMIDIHTADGLFWVLCVCILGFSSLVVVS